MAQSSEAGSRQDPAGREHRSPVHISERFFESRLSRHGLRPRDAAYLIGAFWAIGVVVFGVVERLVDPKTFHSVWMGMWWAVETVTTVGYGDIVPSQTVGKVIAAFLMLGGLSLLSVVTAAITSGFVSRAQARLRGSKDDPVLRALNELGAQIEQLRSELGTLREGGDSDSPQGP